MSDEELTEYIRGSTIPVNEIEDNLINSFQWLSNEIYLAKSLIKTNSVQFIIVKILNRQRKVIDIQLKDYFNVYVVGNFKKSFNPALKVAEAFASFYSELGVLPNIIPLPKYIIKKDTELLHKLRNGVLIYERR